MLPEDYEEGFAAVGAEADRKAAKSAMKSIGKAVADRVAKIDDAASIRDDTVTSVLEGDDETLPDSRGMMVREVYCLYGHFQFLMQPLPTTGKLRFFLDQDSGIRATCFAAFSKEILERKVEGVLRQNC